MKWLANRYRSRLDMGCAYCGHPFRWYQRVTMAYDNHGLVHLKCASLGRVGFKKG